MFKVFRSLLSSVQIDSPNEIVPWSKLLFVKGIMKTICDILLYVFLEGTVHLHKIVESHLKKFTVMCCSTLSFVGSHFIYLISLAPLWCL